MDEIQAYYYSRYGLADVLLHEFGASRATALSILNDLTEEEFEEAAKSRLNALRSEIRLQFPTEGLVPKAAIEGTRVMDPSGEVEEQVAAKGFYIRPHVLLSAKALNGRYGLLRSYFPTKKAVIQRFYPPATKLSLGKKSADNASGSLPFILACQVTTLTTAKAARKSGESDRSAVIPDLPLPELITYVQLFGYMQSKATNPRAGTVRKSGEGVNVNDNRGNFPEAPRQWAFGGLGVMAAIGTWARDNKSLALAQPVLDVLAGSRFYVIDTSDTTRPRMERAGQHIERLSTNHDLARILRNAWMVETTAQDDDFYRVFRRWLLHFNEPTFSDFLAVRAQYPTEFEPIIEEYFMQTFDADLITSARIAAQHVSNQAYFAADGKREPEKRRKNTQKILAGLESMLRDCSDGPEMLARLSVQVGRLTGSSFPEEAQLFFDAVTTGQIGIEDARNVLFAYMRLRSPSKQPANDKPANDKNDKSDAQLDGAEATDPLAEVDPL